MSPLPDSFASIAFRVSAPLSVLGRFAPSAHPLGEQFLPPVTVFRQRWVRVLLRERLYVGGVLQFLVVHADAGGIEVPIHVIIPGSHEQVCVNRHAEHAVDLVAP